MVDVVPADGASISPSEGGTYTIEFESGSVVVSIELSEEELQEVIDEAEKAIEMGIEEYHEKYS